MKVLYITSGFTRSYPHQFIDHFITTSFASVPRHQIRVFQLNPDLHNWGGKLLAMARTFKPDYIFTIHGGFLSKNTIQKLKEVTKAVTGVWFIDDPYDIQSSISRLYDWDFIFTNELASVPVYKRHRYPQVYYLPLGVQTQIYYPETVPPQYQSDLCFVGSPFPRRVEMVKGLLVKFPRLRFKIIGPYWNRYLPRSIDLINHPLAPEQIRKFYNGAKINLNIHRDDTEHIDGINLNPNGIPATSPNNRIFDICACNSFQVVDYREGLRDYFNLKNDLISFKSFDDLVQKIEHYLENHQLRKHIATNGYKKVLARHRIEDRIQEMVGIIERNLKHAGRLAESKAPSPAPRPQPHAGHGHRSSGSGSEPIPSDYEDKLIKGERPAIYLVRHGQKHLIPNLQFFDEYGFRWEDVYILPQAKVDQIPNGEPMS